MDSRIDRQEANVVNNNLTGGTQIIAEYQDSPMLLRDLKNIPANVITSPNLQARKAALLTDLVKGRVEAKERALKEPGGIDYESREWKCFKADLGELIDRMKAADNRLKEMKGEVSARSMSESRSIAEKRIDAVLDKRYKKGDK